MPEQRVNPKLIGSNIIDAKPQHDQCPLACDECFTRHIDPPVACVLPSMEEVGDRIVRVNAIGDSNVDRNHVLATTSGYKLKFYNTSIPKFAFPAPVVFCCNGRKPLFVECPPNVMAVRVRFTAWDVEMQDRLIEHYGNQGIALLLTWMRYHGPEGIEKIPLEHRGQYEYRRHVAHDYWQMRVAQRMQWLGTYRALWPEWDIRSCGALPPVGDTELCKDCGNCASLFWPCHEKLRRKGASDA